ncbi:MAG TPA: hypothetical protein ENK60_00760 [Anaerolineae bacterium]|nr:hypothetical protein [Anaerolineae bacterium]
MRYLTEQDILNAAARGETTLVLGPGVRMTDLARETAQRLGVKLIPTAPEAPAFEPDLHAQVRAAVIARLGREPEGLDAVIDGVLRALGGES